MRGWLTKHCYLVQQGTGCPSGPADEPLRLALCRIAGSSVVTPAWEQHSLHLTQLLFSPCRERLVSVHPCTVNCVNLFCKIGI